MKPDNLPVSRTKVMVPALRPEILRRERLLSLMDEIIDRKLYLICAPAGYGKTSLLVDLASNSTLPVCWFTVDALDQDPQRFITYFLAAIVERYPRFGTHSREAILGLASLENSLENLIITISNEIYEQVNEHFILVIDDYQFVDSVPEIRDFIGRFLQLAGENCHLVLSSRRLPALPDMTLLVSRDQVGGYSMEELAFQPDEVRRLYEKSYGIQITDEDLGEVMRQTEGWITGLLLTKPGMAGSLPDLTRSVRATGIDLATYLDHQVLSRENDEVRAFLLETSLFDEFDADLCALVLERVPGAAQGNWKKLIETVRESNLFVLPVGPGGRWLRYHHLFQEFLRARLMEEQPEQTGQILTRLAEVYEQRSDWEKARRVYIQMGDHQGALALVERAGSHLINNDRLITLGEWLEEIPELSLREHPILLSLSGALKFLRGDIQEGLGLLDQAISDLKSSPDTYNLAVSLSRRANVQRYLGNYSASIEDAEKAIETLSAAQGHPEIEAEALRMKGLALFRFGRARQALDCLERSLEKFVAIKWEKSIPVVQADLGMAYRAIGEYSTAMDWYSKALATWKKSGAVARQSNLLNSVGVLYQIEGEYEKAVQCLEEAMAQARRSGFPRTQALVYASLGDVYAELEDRQLAEQAYRHTENYAHQTNDRFLLHYAVTARAGLARAFGEYGKARSLLTEIRASVASCHSDYEHGLYRLEYGRLEVHDGQPAKAVEHLMAALDLFSRGDLFLELATSRLWLARAYLRKGDPVAAGNQIKELGSLFNGREYPPSLCLAAGRMRESLVDLDDDAGSQAILNQLFHEAEKNAADLPSRRRRIRHLARSVSALPARMEIRMLGKSQVRINGRLVTSSQWRTREVRELFFFFVCQPRPISKEDVAAILWPDILHHSFRPRFKNNIYRLRQAVGQTAILFEQEEYRFNRALDYTLDLDEFEAGLFNARISQEDGDRIHYLQTAVNLVHGRFLEDLNATWLLSERERLEQEFLNALLELSELNWKAGRTAEALRACQRAVSWDQCYEAAHCLLMRIYADSGDRAAVKGQYLALTRALKTELGVPPGKETEELYRSLVS